MSKIKRFFQKVKAFSKRNAYALVVAFCVICVFSVITAVSVAELYKVDKPTQRQEQEDPNVEPTGGDDVIVFDSPVKDANISKEYAEDHVVEDKTSGAWKAHLGIDYAGPEGTKVLAAYDGTVESIDNSLMDGVVITIDIVPLRPIVAFLLISIKSFWPFMKRCSRASARMSWSPAANISLPALWRNTSALIFSMPPNGSSFPSMAKLTRSIPTKRFAA